MTDPHGSDPSQGYGSTPPPSSGYSVPSQQPSAYPPPPPTYPPPTYPPPTYPPADYLAPMPAAPAGFKAPGQVTAAAVLGYVYAGLMLLCGLLFVAASGFVDEYLPGSGVTVAAIALIPLALGVLFIISAVQFQQGKNRAFLISMAAIGGVFQLISLISGSGDVTPGSIIEVVLLALPVLIIVFAAHAASTAWVAAHQAMPLLPPPPPPPPPA